MLIWNKFAPDSWKIKDEDRKKFSNATFTAVHDTIIAVIDFAKELADSFGAGFKEKLAPFKASWESLSKTFGEIVDAFKEKDIAGEAKGGLVGIAKQVGGAVASQSTVTVNFTGNVLSQDFIEDEAIPIIKEAVRRGADIGVA